ncbi:hypothetical protein ALO88_102712 [Pseudomonas syringae pv. antirrhini]|uniref:Uncharacterized protein n=1 Tax=Pseudomonas syringae pv. antirrhini TaxID=251702 RepID=A0A0N8QPC9_9PSED|nr:hypothetical protein ALO88_102712 [Pseudomonas syringae pv. antirrhini]RMP42787.1 hypothetical protein ALQ23_102499 [Pseudomonas syringae pv. antirrhini]
MGCEAALNQVNSVLPDKPYAPLLPVPGSSRTSPLLHTGIPAYRHTDRSQTSEASSGQPL